MWQAQVKRSEREERRKRRFPVRSSLGHKAKNLVTVIFIKMGSYRECWKNQKTEPLVGLVFFDLIGEFCQISNHVSFAT